MPDSTRMRRLTVIAQDPSFTRDGNIVTARIPVPAEELWPGPMGYRIHVIDYDASTDTLYKAYQGRLHEDPFESIAHVDTDRLVNNPQFHQQNVYAIAMSTLGRFEAALGRRVNWEFPHGGHQLKIAPHALREPNAFYSRDDEALLFGYFRGESGDNVFTCLSHDIVVHETTHALLDGLRPRFLYPSSLDQAAFHEGFSDIVAILSVFSLPEVLDAMIDSDTQADEVSLRNSAVLKLAQQMGRELASIRGEALRNSALLDPEPVRLHPEHFNTPHRRGEVLVAAILRSFVRIWASHVRVLDTRAGHRVPEDDERTTPRSVDRVRVIDAGTEIAHRLLTAAIRALDYTPPVDLLFDDYLSALLTADSQVNPDDRHGLRRTLKYVFAEYGINPPRSADAPTGTWQPARDDLCYEGLHFESMQRDPSEVFRFVWENRDRLGIHDTYAFVPAVRPSLRIDEDGLPVRETVATYIQVLTLKAGELRQVKLAKPSSCDDSEKVKLYGGGALVFDEFGKLRFHIQNKLNSSRQQERLDYVWNTRGSLSARPVRNLSRIHRSRSARGRRFLRERW